MRLLAGILATSLLVACGGSDDDSGGGNTGGTGTGGTATGGSGGSATGGSAGVATGGSGGVATGGAAGNTSLCSSTTNPYDPGSIDCDAACQHYESFGSTGACGNPYAGGDPLECALVCDTTKSTLPYTNAQFGCAAENAECTGYSSCMADKCG